MNNQLRLILDDDAGDFVYSGGQWSIDTHIQWYSRTMTFAKFAESTTVFSSFSLQFEGTQIGFIGNTPFPNLSQFFNVAIDGGSSVNMSYAGDLPPQAYVQWYQTPVLSDGKHTIQVDHLPGTSVDIAIITVGPNTSLENKTVFVDDLDGAIQYFGSWVRDNSGINAGGLPDALPVGTTTHRSSTVGDSIAFRFSGISVAVYGVFSWNNVGLLSVSFTLDGYVVVQPYPVNIDSSEHVSGWGDEIHFLFYSNASIPSGDHTLVIAISEVDSMSFILDYITYTPSFATFATMPNLTVASCLASDSSLATCSPPASISTSSPTQISQNVSLPSSKTAPMGAVVSAAVGGSVALIVLVVTLFFLRLRKQRKFESEALLAPTIGGTQFQHRDGLHHCRQEELTSSEGSNSSAVSNTGTTPFLNFFHSFPTLGGFERTGIGRHPRIQASIAVGFNPTDQARSNVTYGLQSDAVAELGPPAYEA